MKLFITGLPRSKTAWMAAYFTSNDKICLHDGIEKGQVLRPNFSLSNSAIGNSDCANSIFYKELNNAYPTAKWVVIERSVADVKRSISNSIGTTRDLIDKTIPIFSDALSEVKYHLKPFVLPYNFNEEEFIKLHEYLSLDFNKERYYLMRGLNIQVTKDRISELIKDYS